MCFYEKVEKVKGRRGGHPYYFFPAMHKTPGVTWGAVKGVP
jgi:hypothetical protein